jgi:hypothetical protein
MRTRSCLFVPTRFFHGKEGVVGSSPTEGLADFQGFYQDRRAAGNRHGTPMEHATRFRDSRQGLGALAWLRRGDRARSAVLTGYRSLSAQARWAARTRFRARAICSSALIR